MFFSVDFWRFTSERAIKSFAQSLLAVLSVGGLGVLEVNWVTALSTSAMATVLSILTSIGSAAIGPKDDPSVVSATDTSGQPAPGRHLLAA